ncbi:MAG: hypothetical protein V3V99_11690 [candidate division Zixibacteria bacterium]
MLKIVRQEKSIREKNCADSDYNKCCSKCKNQVELMSVRSIVGNFIPGDNWIFDGFILK